MVSSEAERQHSQPPSMVPVMHSPLWLGAPHPGPGCSAETSSWCYLLSSLILPHPEPPACLLDTPGWPVRLRSSSCTLHHHQRLRNRSPCTESMPLCRQNSNRMFTLCYLHEKQLLPKPRVAFTGVLCLQGKGTDMRAKKSFRQNLKKVFVMGTSESASPAGWPRDLKVQNSGYRDSQKREGPTETALNWDASVYFLNCYLRNTRKGMTSHRWHSSGKQQDKETLWKRA